MDYSILKLSDIARPWIGFEDAHQSLWKLDDPLLVGVEEEGERLLNGRGEATEQVGVR